MAKSVALQLTVMLLVVLAVTTTVRPERQERILNHRSREFTVYLQLIFGGPNANLVPVAGRPGRPRTLTEFGTTIVGDVLVTKDVSIDSPQIGQAQGMLVVGSLNATELYYSFSLVFNENGEYNGSTLEFQGTLKLGPLGNNGEVSITSGTEYFRYARGFAVARTVLQNAATGYSVNKVDINLKYDD